VKIIDTKSSPATRDPKRVMPRLSRHQRPEGFLPDHDVVGQDEARP
jgi:hypothetical protein